MISIALAIFLYCGDPYLLVGWDLSTNPPLAPLYLDARTIERGSDLDLALGVLHDRAKEAGTLEYVELVKPVDRHLTCVEKINS